MSSSGPCSALKNPDFLKFLTTVSYVKFSTLIIHVYNSLPNRNLIYPGHQLVIAGHYPLVETALSLKGLFTYSNNARTLRILHCHSLGEDRYTVI